MAHPSLTTRETREIKALIGFHHGLYCHVCATWQQRRVSRQAVVKVCEGFRFLDGETFNDKGNKGRLELGRR